MKSAVVDYYQHIEYGRTYHKKRYGGKLGSLRKKLIYTNLLQALKTSDLQDKHVLEVAPGSGSMTKLLLQKFPRLRLTAVDSSAEMIAFLKAKITAPSTFIEADAKALPFKSSSFDIIFALRFLIHYGHPQPFIKEFERVLKPGGLLVVDAHNFFRLDILNTFVRRYINPKGLLNMYKVESYYLFPWELAPKYQTHHMKIINILGHKCLPMHTIVLRLLGEKKYMLLEHKLKQSFYRYFASDVYITLQKLS